MPARSLYVLYLCVCSFKNAEAKRKLAALTDMLESIEKTEDLIKENRQDCERKIQAEQLRQKEVSYLLQQINKLQNDLKGSTKESGMCTNRSCICSEFSLTYFRS